MVECPWCDYEGVVSEVEAHISGSTDDDHTGRVGHNLHDQLPDERAEEESGDQSSLEHLAQEGSESGEHPSSDVLDHFEDPSVDGEAPSEDTGTEVEPTSEDTDTEAEPTSESETEQEGGGADSGRKLVGATVLFVIGAVLMAVETGSSGDEEEESEESDQNDQQPDTPLLEA